MSDEMNDATNSNWMGEIVDNYDAFNDFEVSALIESADWPTNPTLQAMQDGSGTAEERKAALIAALRAMDAFAAANPKP